MAEQRRELLAAKAPIPFAAQVMRIDLLAPPPGFYGGLDGAARECAKKRDRSMEKAFLEGLKKSHKRLEKERKWWKRLNCF